MIPEQVSWTSFIISVIGDGNSNSCYCLMFFSSLVSSVHFEGPYNSGQSSG
jgi:hypothetical protein